MKEYLSKYQSVFYNTLLNSKKRGKFPQAILLNGSKDIPLLEIAKYSACWIVCDGDEPSEDDIKCIKINNGNYADLIVIDGKNQTIKKGEIEKMQERFSLSSVEDNAKRIYIINLIEHSTSEAINSLLKFLEEPDEDTYAIITTENINNVLPTIISRCLNLRLSKASKRELVVEAIKKGIVLEDALVLASFNGSMSLIEDCYNNSKYISLKDLVIEMFNEYVEGENILYFSQVEMGDVTLDKVNFRLFLDILDLFLLDVVNYDSEDVNFVEHKDLLKNVHDKMPNISDKVEKIMRYKSQIDLNANLKLLLDSVIINLKGE